MNDLPQPSRKNWRLYGWVVAGGIALTMLVVFMAIHGSDGQPPKEEKIVERNAMEKMPDRSFNPPPSPPPAPVVITPTPVSLPPNRPPQPVRQVPSKSPVPDKPMVSRFAGGEDSKAFSDQKNSERDTENGDNQKQRNGPVIDPKDNRPGSSEGVNWLNSAGNDGKDFVVSPYLPPMGEYVLQAGTIIKATLLNNVNSDLPGDVVAMVNENIMDTASGRYILIPATAKLYGRYSDSIRYGATRAQISWNRILMPNAASLNIGSMSGTDAGGAAGVEGEVDHHLGGMAAAVGVSAFMTVLGQAGTIITGGSGGSTNIGSVGIDGGGREVQSIGREFVTKELDRPNTLYLKAGTTVAVMLSRDVVTLQPYGSRDNQNMVESKW